MSLRQFEYALAVAEEGSVTAAAEALRVAQPSVSQQIRGLERDLGVELFSRTPTGLVPTVAGRAFLRDAEIAVNAARRARATARAGSEELAGELVVAVQMGLGTRQLPGALSALRRRFPRLEVTVFEEPNPTELERLARGGVIDLALMAGPCDEGLYDGHHLGDEEFVVVLAAGHPQLAVDRVALRDLERGRGCGSTRPARSTAYWWTCCGRTGWPRPPSPGSPRRRRPCAGPPTASG